MPQVPYSVTKESYLLKSTFIYDKLRANSYFDMFMQIQTLCGIEGSSLNWAKRAEWRISDTAWQVLEANSINPMLVFLHPKVYSLIQHFLKIIVLWRCCRKRG